MQNVPGHAAGMYAKLTENTLVLPDFLATGLQNSAQSMKAAGMLKHATTSKKGETMPVFESFTANPCDCSEPLAVTCTIQLTVNLRLISTWLDKDFLCWSRRQKDAEIVIEYDV